MGITTYNIPGIKKGGGGGGTDDYNVLINKPKINGVEIVGNKSLAELGNADTFFAKYGSTTFAEIKEKYDKGWNIVVEYDNYIYYLTYYKYAYNPMFQINTQFALFSCNTDNISRIIYIDFDDWYKQDNHYMQSRNYYVTATINESDWVKEEGNDYYTFSYIYPYTYPYPNLGRVVCSPTSEYIIKASDYRVILYDKTTPTITSTSYNFRAYTDDITGIGKIVFDIILMSYEQDVNPYNIRPEEEDVE